MKIRIQLACGAAFCALLILAPRVFSQAAPLPAPVFPFGAVYFRKSNPPEQDWERDHKTAAQMGMNIFRHWFMWASIENAPGRYDWRDYDRMVELEGQNHIKSDHRRNHHWRARVDVGQVSSRASDRERRLRELSCRRRQQRNQQRAPLPG